MHIVDTAEFYTQALGKATLDLLFTRLSKHVPQQNDALVMGLGYASPYLASSARHLSFMMARGGVVHWPMNAAVKSALVDDLALPLPDNSVDMALLIHALEFSESAEDMLAEIWRVLAPQGKLVLVVPNRRGLWAISDATPFGQGQPFSRGQLMRLLKEAQFSVATIEPAFVAPPKAGPRLLRALEPLTRLGIGGFAGLNLAVATKQIHAYSIGRPVRRALPRFRPVLLPGAQPIAKK
jgi:SAM-dependent methyltransferase